VIEQPDQADLPNDDFQKILPKLQDPAVAGLIIGSPVYFGLITGQLKVMMDRSVPIRAYKRSFGMEGKVGGGIACGAFRNGGQELTLQCIHTFMLQHNMMVVSDGQPYAHSGATIVGSAKDDELGLKTVTNLAKNIAAMLIH